MQNLFSALALALMLEPSFALADTHSHVPYQTVVLFGNLPPGGDSLDAMAHGDAPTFATTAALDEYFNKANGGSCDDNCLLEEWRSLAHKGLAGKLHVGHRVTVVDMRPDPADDRYKLCRVRFTDNNKTESMWLICTALKD